MSIVGLLVLFLLGVCACVGLYLVLAPPRGRSSGPVCGACGYSLVGSVSNTCPECGRMFIEAGVIVHPVHRSRRRVVGGLVLLLLPLILMVGSSLAYLGARRATAARQRAVVARQAAAAAQQAQVITGRQTAEQADTAGMAEEPQP